MKDSEEASIREFTRRHSHVMKAGYPEKIKRATFILSSLVESCAVSGSHSICHPATFVALYRIWYLRRKEECMIKV